MKYLLLIQHFDPDDRLHGDFDLAEDAQSTAKPNARSSTPRLGGE
jgi:hypothetical protein